MRPGSGAGHAAGKDDWMAKRYGLAGKSGQSPGRIKRQPDHPAAIYWLRYNEAEPAPGKSAEKDRQETAAGKTGSQQAAWTDDSIQPGSCREKKMEYFIKQRVLSFRSEFDIRSRYGEVLYTARGEMLSFGHRLHLLDGQGREAACIEQRVMAWTPKYEIFLHGQLLSTLNMKIAFRPRFYVAPQDWQIEGDFTGHDYSFFQGDWKFAHVDKEWMTWGDSYRLEVEDDNVALLVLCLMLAVDLAKTGH